MIPILLFLSCWLVFGCAGRSNWQYPQTPVTNVLEMLHGVRVADPYRWLEDDRAPATKAWIEAQNQLTFSHLTNLPGRDGIKRRLTQLWNYERMGVPSRHANRFFVMRNDGLQNQNVLHVMDSLQPGAASLPLLDPNRLATDGTASLSGIAVSPNARHVAYGISKSGSDWQEWRIREVESGRDLADVVRWVKFSEASWARDGSGFFYSRFDEPSSTDEFKAANFGHKLYFHRLGTDQRADQLIYERPDQKEWRFAGKVTEDGNYLIISVRRTGTKTQVFYLPSGTPNSRVTELITGFDASYDFIDNDGTRFWFQTDHGAPKGRIIEIDLRHPSRDQWKTVIQESDDTLRQAILARDHWICSYLKDARSQIRLFSLDGRPSKEVKLPELGTATDLRGKRNHQEAFFSFASYTSPDRVFQLNPSDGSLQIIKATQVAFDPAAFETRQVFFPSKDGTQIPMFITHRRGLRLDGTHPLLLYGYGGFNIPMVPNFSVPTMVWLEMGGVYAVANIRGGGEYGENWHSAGTKHHKQNVFDDFIAAAEWLVNKRYTSSQRLAIEGRSNGGLLVGACLTQRPGLFKAALPGVGVMDMLRFHKFTIGWAWTSDFGSPDVAEEFRSIRAYSPLHNLRPGTRYPATLITTADHDDRVVPAHSFKFAAAMQSAQAGPPPVLIRIDTQAGHGAGKSTTKQIEEVTDKWAFLTHELKMTVPKEW